MLPLVPQVPNLNGTSKQSLVEGYSKVLDGVTATLDALSAATPNGRDYQTVDSDQINKALAAWRERYEMLCRFKNELEVAALSVMNAEGGH